MILCSIVFLLGCSAAVHRATAAQARGPMLPALPQKIVDTLMPVQTGREFPVSTSGALQSAIDTAHCGDTIVLQAGVTFSGRFVLPNKPCAGWVVLQSSRVSELPAGKRVTPAQAPLMAKIESQWPGQPPIRARAGAHHYRLIGLEVTTLSGTRQNSLLNFDAAGDGTSRQSSVEQQPHHIIVDRCYVHGDPVTTVRRAVSFQVAYGAVIESYISEIHEVGADSQAIVVWNGEGPFLYRNNYLSAAGENIMWGGADPAIPNLVPSDITVEGNHIAKDPAWRTSAHKWTVKNLVEFKNARRVLVTGNVIEFNWLHSQNGFAILLSPRNQSGHCPWCTVEDVTFTNNLLRHSGSGITIAPSDDLHPSLPAARILIRNNLLMDISRAWGGANGRAFQVLSSASRPSGHDVTIDHNTVFQDGPFLTFGDHGMIAAFQFANNIVMRRSYGVVGSGKGEGLSAISAYAPGAIWEGVVVIGRSPVNRYPLGTTFVETERAVGFANASAGDYSLSPSSPFRGKARDGTDIGVDMKALNIAISGAREP